MRRVFIRIQGRHDRPSGSIANASAPARRSTRLGLIYAALVAATLAPLAIWPIPPSFDLVNHWARLTLYHMAPGDPLAALYQVRLAPIPISPSISPATRSGRSSRPMA